MIYTILTKRINPIHKFLFIYLLNTACTTTYIIDTKPSDVEVIINKNSIGKTPLSFDETKAGETIANGKLVTLTKKGYRSIKLWLPIDGREYKVSVNLNPFFDQTLVEKANSSSREIPRDRVFQITSRLLRIQQNLLSNNDNNSVSEKDIQELESLIESNPTIGSLHFLKAVNLLKKGEKNNAILYLTDAVRYSPYQTDFILLKKEIEAEGKNP